MVQFFGVRYDLYGLAKVGVTLVVAPWYLFRAQSIVMIVWWEHNAASSFVGEIFNLQET